MSKAKLKILVVEDEPKVASFIKRGLEENDYSVEIAYDGFSGSGLFTQDYVLDNWKGNLYSLE